MLVIVIGFVWLNLGSLVKDIPFAVRTKIERMMNVNDHNDHNWRGLAAAMMLSVDDVRQLDEGENGKMTGLFDNMIDTKKTIKDFFVFLKHPAVQRLDVIDEIIQGCGLPKEVSENESFELDETGLFVCLFVLRTKAVYEPLFISWMPELSLWVVYANESLT